MPNLQRLASNQPEEEGEMNFESARLVGMALCFGMALILTVYIVANELIKRRRWRRLRIDNGPLSRVVGQERKKE